MKKTPLISGSWDEGRIWDLWMLVHFGAGAVAGCANVFLELPFRTLLLWSVGGLVAWEVGEAAAGVRESMENRLIDLVVGVAGLFAAAWLIDALPVTGGYLAFGICLLLSSAGAFAGWRAYKARAR
jgi:hypothetical protein